MSASKSKDPNLSTRSKPSVDSSKDPVGLLVVHGIGNQDRGDTLDSILDGLCYAYNDSFEVQREDKNHAILKGIGRPVHIFEVYWADLLRGEAVEGTFDFDRIFEVAWFPLLNYRSGLLSPAMYSKGHVLRWTFILAPLTSLLFSAYNGANFISSVFSGFRDNRQESASSQNIMVNIREAWNSIRSPSGNSENKKYGEVLIKNSKRGLFVENLMDQVVGDVFNYVQGAADAFPVTNEKSRKLVVNVDKIHKRFLAAAKKAKQAGCSEIQVLAHSLGTVIAFRSMFPGNGYIPFDNTVPRITRFYTIGSPLEKIRFFWPRLLERSRQSSDIASDGEMIAAGNEDDSGLNVTWHNFFTRVDLVSGKLRRFAGWPEAKNCKARGLGGMIRSHGAYNRNPAFLAQLGKGLTGEEAPEVLISPLRRFGKRVIAGLENLIFPVSLLFLAAFGLLALGIISWGSGWLFSRPFDWLGLDLLARGIRLYVLYGTLAGGTILPIWQGSKNAKELHKRFWNTKTGE